MKRKLKGLLSLWLVVLLTMSMTISAMAAEVSVRVYQGDTPIGEILTQEKVEAGYVVYTTSGYPSVDGSSLNLEEEDLLADATTLEYGSGKTMNWIVPDKDGKPLIGWTIWGVSTNSGNPVIPGSNIDVELGASLNTEEISNLFSNNYGQAYILEPIHEELSGETPEETPEENPGENPGENSGEGPATPEEEPETRRDPIYRIDVEEAKNGAVKSSHRWAEEGDTVQLIVVPEMGHTLTSLTVTDRDGKKIEVAHKVGSIYTFQMSTRSVTVTASFGSDWDLGYQDCPRDQTCPYWPYTDTNTHAWYHDGVHFCVENGLMSGYGDKTFAPGGAVTRQQVWMILARLSDASPADMAQARLWAMESGVSDGTLPTAQVTRQQLVTMLWRYAQYKGYDVSVGEDTNILSYGDAFIVSEYAIPAMQWACGSGMIQGKETESGMVLEPEKASTRAQMATMLMRFCAEIAK